tara:strand:+ start:7416 stop:7796 length:381 start_codon:yes stop_codon:yes gene_type:complete
LKNQEEPERLSHEWHAKRYETKAKAWEDACELCGEEAEDSWHEKVLKFRDLAAKLRQAAVDAAENSRLGKLLLDLEHSDFDRCHTCEEVHHTDEMTTAYDEEGGAMGRFCEPCEESAPRWREKTDE